HSVVRRVFPLPSKLPRDTVNGGSPLRIWQTPAIAFDFLHRQAEVPDEDPQTATPTAALSSSRQTRAGMTVRLKAQPSAPNSVTSNANPPPRLERSSGCATTADTGVGFIWRRRRQLSANAWGRSSTSSLTLPNFSSESEAM